jgi:lipopolysaccharide/colanic/teichoic acid biosynthesis glycosyltransferase
MKLSISREGRGVGGRPATAKRPSLSRTLWRTLASLPSADQMERLVTREVARAERNGLHFSLAVFRVRRGGRLGLNEKRLALTLLRRARLTDEVGWFDDAHLCAVLPDTCARGAQIFADAVCDLLARKGPRPIAVVYSFPHDWFRHASDDGDDTDDDGDNDGGPTRGGRRPHGADADGRPGLAAGAPDALIADALMSGRLRMRLAGTDQAVLGDRGPGTARGTDDSGPRNRLTGTDGGVAVHGGVAVLNGVAPSAVVDPLAPALALAADPRPVRGVADADGPEVRPLHDLLVRPAPPWKRAIDVVGAAGLLAAFSPVLLAAAVAIKLGSKGPVVFTQRRAGLGGRPFTIYKFRTMCADAEAKKKALRALSEQDGPAFKMARDPRITRVGAFLRKTSLDELPQLFNVLKGDMSLVGPAAAPGRRAGGGRAVAAAAARRHPGADLHLADQGPQPGDVRRVGPDGRRVHAPPHPGPRPADPAEDRPGRAAAGAGRGRRRSES